MKRIDLLMAALLASAGYLFYTDASAGRESVVTRSVYSATLGRNVTLTACDAPVADDAAECVTDSECAEQCPAGTRDLPADHPDYCDGGPKS